MSFCRERPELLSGPKDLQLSFPPLKNQCRSFALKGGTQDDMHVGSTQAHLGRGALTPMAALHFTH